VRVYDGAVIDRVPYLLDGDVADGNAATRPIAEEANGIGVAEARGHGVDKDGAARLFAGLTGAGAVRTVGVGYVERQVIGRLRETAIDEQAAEIASLIGDFFPRLDLVRRIR
jgi:hypothetical protein